jgi:hypothetical protein
MPKEARWQKARIAVCVAMGAYLATDVRMKRMFFCFPNISNGFDVLKSGRKVRVTFKTPIHTMNEARQALIAMAQR